MSRTKKVPFVDALDIYLEVCTEDEFRGVISHLGVWAKIRKLGFRIRLESDPVTVKKSLPLLDAADKGGK